MCADRSDFTETVLNGNKSKKTKQQQHKEINFAGLPVLWHAGKISEGQQHKCVLPGERVRCNPV